MGTHKFTTFSCTFYHTAFPGGETSLFLIQQPSEENLLSDLR